MLCHVVNSCGSGTH